MTYNYIRMYPPNNHNYDAMFDLFSLNSLYEINFTFIFISIN
jgi:hypothetical protein